MGSRWCVDSTLAGCRWSIRRRWRLGWFCGILQRYQSPVSTPQLHRGVSSLHQRPTAWTLATLRQHHCRGRPLPLMLQETQEIALGEARGHRCGIDRISLAELV
ncbi:MAG: hypothetical protein M1396_02965 [Chloroflexi bacterium]|nr:hypothetical protein [Chloroflexota bacterium]